MLTFFGFYQLEKWDESVRDYEFLVQEMPGDEEVVSALAEVQGRRKSQEREREDMNSISDLVVIKNPDQLSDLIKSMGNH